MLGIMGEKKKKKLGTVLQVQGREKSTEKAGSPSSYSTAVKFL